MIIYLKNQIYQLNVLYMNYLVLIFLNNYDHQNFH